MMKTRQGRGRERLPKALLAAIALCASSAAPAYAVLPRPYDFAGHWGGTATERGTGQTGSLSVDFVATQNPRKFSGSSTLVAGQTSVCPFTAKYRKNLMLHPHCGGSASVVVVHFDPLTVTLTGSFPIGHHHVADFTLERTPA